MSQRRYRRIGEEVSAETTLAQAAQAFDIASVFAEESKDIENLIRIGMAWVDFSRLLGDPGEESEDDDEKEDDEPRVLGFTGKRSEDGGTQSEGGPISAGSNSRNR